MKKNLIILLSLFLLIFFIPKIVFASIYFSDDFESGSFDKWEIIFGNWTIGDYQNSKWAVASSTKPQYEIQAGSFDWTDYEFSFDMLPKFGEDKNVFFRVKNQRTFVLPNRDLPVGYMLHLKSDKFILKKWTPKIGEELEKVFIGFPVNVVSKIKIRLENNNIKVFINNSNTPALDYTDENEPFLSGRIALAAIPGAVSSVVWYDNVVVRELPSESPPTNKVVVVPGMGASWNADAILNCKENNEDWTLAPFAEDIYNPLFSSLENAGLEQVPFYYDWREEATENGRLLNNLINAPDGEKVHLVGHSMGGLVGRAYLESEEENNKLDKMMTVGSPHKGSALSYPPWSGGKVWNDNFIAKIATTLLIKRCGGFHENDRDVIWRMVPSLQDLLPTEDYLVDKKSKDIKPVSKMDAQNSWLTSVPSNSFPFYDVEVGTLSGTGFKTLEIIKVRNRNKRDFKLGNWEDGKPAGKEFSLEGDGTVLLTSSQIANANDNIVINQTHSGLVASEEGISEILSFLSGEELSIQSSSPYSEPESTIIVIGYPASFTVVSPNNNIKTSKEGVVAFSNPKSGKYKLSITPESSETLLVIGQFLKNGKYKWKEYTLKNHLPKFGTIEFNSENLLENPF